MNLGTQAPADRWRSRLEIAALVVTIVVGTALAVKLSLEVFGVGRPPTQVTRVASPAPQPGPRPPAPLPIEPVSLEGAALKGDPNAKVAIIAYSDFHCPYCERFARDTYPALNRSFIETGQVVFAFRHLPLEDLHPRALRAAEAAECAGQQGQFWAMHDRMFLGPKAMDDAALRRYAEAVELDLPAFDTCMKVGVTGKVRAEGAAANALGVVGTPTFLVGTRDADGRVLVTDRLVGAQPLDAFGAVIQEVLRQVSAIGEH